MLSFIKKLFGINNEPAKVEEAPYKVETQVVASADVPVVVSIPTEGAGLVEVAPEAPAKKPRAKKPAAIKATKKPAKAKKAK